jgi:DNA-binding PadR family transcriptional regulator
MLQMAILGLLKDRAMHGYELKKELTAQLGQLWQVSWGSLYPALNRLDKSGAVERIFPKSEVRRRKNIYRITPKGEEVFAEALAEDTATLDDARFGLKLAFFRYVKPETRVELLERRRAYLTEKLAAIRSQLRTYKQRIDDYTYRLMEHGMETTTADIAWIDRLIADEKAARRKGGGRAAAGAARLRLGARRSKG